MYLYKVENLESARIFLANFTDDVVLVNHPDSINYYGILVVQYILNQLQEEFPQVKKITFDLGSSNAALYSAQKINAESME